MKLDKVLCTVDWGVNFPIVCFKVQLRMTLIIVLCCLVFMTTDVGDGVSILSPFGRS
jgi:hypothetical protein